jgi:hypothetical protein
MMPQYVYSLTNLEFRGTRRTDYEDGSWSFDTLVFVYKDVRCALRQIAGYKEVIKELSETNGGAVTATLTLEGDLVRTKDEMDALADSICDLLAFAKKNEVYWIGRVVFGEGEEEVSSYRRSLGGRVRDFHSGWAIVDDTVMTAAGHRDELQLFLIATVERYHDSLRQRLRTALLWITEAEHYGFVDLQFMCLYIAIERLRIDFLSTKAKDYIHPNWQAMLDGEFANDILRVIREKTGPLQPEQERLLISKLRGANTPPTPVLLDELCRELEVLGLEKDMGVLRNKLTHTATYGDFDFPKVLDLHVRLSHVVDVCVSKILAYDGYYCHRAIGWRHARVGEQPPSETDSSLQS